MATGPMSCTNEYTARFVPASVPINRRGEESKPLNRGKYSGDANHPPALMTVHQATTSISSSPVTERHAVLLFLVLIPARVQYLRPLAGRPSNVYHKRFPAFLRYGSGIISVIPASNSITLLGASGACLAARLIWRLPRSKSGRSYTGDLPICRAQ